MILLQASHIVKQYPGHEVLQDASVQVQSGERVALVGPNGAGKTTLLHILTGQETADAGEVSLAKGITFGYVEQFVEAGVDEAVYDYVAAVFAELYGMETRLREMETAMANPAIYADPALFSQLAAAYDRLRLEFEAKDGYAVDARVRRVLIGLEFPTPTHRQSVASLSGGQKTRLSLARLLAWQPDLLVLDEPTNYLDTETLSWLEDYLQNYPGAVLMVSHDRYFLDRIAHKVVELSNGVTTAYVGNYTRYIEQKTADITIEGKRYEQQQREIQRMETFVQKNIVRATTTRRAQSRRKLLDKLVRLEKPQEHTAQMTLRFTCQRPSGKDVLEVRDLYLGYPGKSLPGPFNLRLVRGQRLALLGPNGVGKTSFLRALVGQLPPLSGSIQWGQYVDVGYYDQEQMDLHPEKTVLQEVWDAYPNLDRTAVRTALGRFLFRGLEVEKPVSGLSGGERSRLALCLLMLRQANVLVMDEPTNHLDLVSKEVLEDALQDYEGTLIFVSHDRYFIDALATRVLISEPGGWAIHPGNYSEYKEKKAEEEKWQSPPPHLTPGGNPAIPGKNRSTAREDTQSETFTELSVGTAMNAPRRTVRSADLRKLRTTVVELEAKIANNEEQQSTVGERLATAAQQADVERLSALDQELYHLQQHHQELLTAWENAALSLENLEQQNSE